MNSLPAMGAPNSFVRYIQENPSEVVQLFRMALCQMAMEGHAELAKALHESLTKNYQIRKQTTLTLPFDITGNLS